MSTLVQDFLNALGRAGLRAEVNAKQKTIDITHVDGRPLLDAWALLLDHDALKDAVNQLYVLRAVVSHAGILEEIAQNVRSDIPRYAWDEGPFRLRAGGVVAPSNPRVYEDWEY